MLDGGVGYTIGTSTSEETCDQRTVVYETMHRCYLAGEGSTNQTSEATPQHKKLIMRQKAWELGGRQ